MAAGNWIVFTKAKEYIGDGTIDLDNATAGGGFKIHLVNGYVPALTHEVLATAAVATAPATNGGQTDISLGTQTWAATGTNMRWDSPTSPVWTATGGTLSATHAIIYADYQTSPADPLVAYCDLDTATSGAVDVTAGNTLTVTFATSGIFTLGGATS